MKNKCIIAKHILKSITEKKFRSILVIVSIAIASAVLYVNLNINDDIIESSSKLYQSATRGYDVAITGDFNQKNLILPKCDQIVSANHISVTIEDVEVNLYECNISDIAQDETVFEEKDVAMSSFNSGFFKIYPGDSLLGYTVKAIIDPPAFLNDSDTSDIDFFIQSSNFKPNILLLKLEKDDNLKLICDVIRTDNPSVEVIQLYDKDDDGFSYHDIRNILLAVLICVVLASSYIIASTVKLIIEAKIPTYATFRSIGASRKNIITLMLLESLLYGLTGGILGIVFGEVLRIILRVSLFNLSAGSIRLKYIIAVPVFSVLLSTFILLLIGLNTAKKSIKELIFNKQNSATKYPVIFGFVGMALFVCSIVLEKINKTYNIYLIILELVLAIFGISMFVGLFAKTVSALFSKLALKRSKGCLFLALKNNSTSKISRNSTILISVVMALLVGIYVAINSLTGFFDIYSKNYPYDVMVKSLKNNEDFYSRKLQIDGTTSINYEYWKYVHDVGINRQLVSVCFLAQNGCPNGITLENGAPDDLNENEFIIDKLLAQKTNLDVGDYIYFSGPVSCEGTIVGLCDSSVFNSKRTTVIMNKDSFLSKIKSSPAIIGFTVEGNNSDFAVSLSKFFERNGEDDVDIINVKEYLGREFNDAVNGLKLASAIPVLITILAIMGLVNNCLISFSQKKQLYATLYSTSMSITQLKKLIFWDLTTNFINGCILGTVLSLRLAKIIRDLVYITVAFIPLDFTFASIFYPLVLLLSCLCLTTIFPVNQLRKMNIVKEIQYE